MSPPEYQVLDVVLFAALLASAAVVFYRIIRQMRLFDKILESAYRNEVELWVRWGGPSGFFWRPEQPVSGFLQQWEARNVLCFTLFWRDGDCPKPKRDGLHEEYIRSGRKLLIWWGVFIMCLGIVICRDLA